MKTDIGEEKEIFCIGQRWNAESFDYSIEVFDSRFIEDNVFTGLTISRSNKENLTNLLIEIMTALLFSQPTYFYPIRQRKIIRR